LFAIGAVTESESVAGHGREAAAGFEQRGPQLPDDDGAADWSRRSPGQQKIKSALTRLQLQRHLH